MPTLGPHEGKELALMLQNNKPLAYFYTDCEIPEEFEPYLKNGRLHCKTIKSEVFVEGQKHEFHKYIISHAPNSPDALRLAEVLEQSHKLGWQEDLERETAKLLGYAQQDIDHYIEHLKKQGHLKP